MIYGYVRHSLNNQKFIDQQIKLLQNSDEKPDEIVVETNRNEQMHKMIEKLKEEDKIVIVRYEILTPIREEDFTTLREKEIEIRTLNGYISSYKHSNDLFIRMIEAPLGKALYEEKHPEEFEETEE